MSNENLQVDYPALYNRAVEIATAAHQGQTRWGGEPYITHPLAVAKLVGEDDPRERIVAVLHDVIEDTAVTAKQLREEFPHRIVDALEAMTHIDGESYTNYIVRLGRNPLARAVKLADLQHNLSDLTDKRHRQRRDKYELAAELLRTFQEMESEYDYR